jgi:hypothetical protein
MAICECTPSTCTDLGLTCGNGVHNGCNGTLDCNTNKVAGMETDVDCGGPVSGCATRCAQGKRCGVTSDCQSGLTCADGVCCNSACNGACEACTAALKGQGNDGVCGAVVSGNTDPHHVCTSQAASTCGDQGGICDGSGACTQWSSGTQCAAPSCSGNVLTKAETCAGGACAAPSPATQDCAPYTCVNDACATTCASDGECAPGNYCDLVGAGSCVAQLANGAPCAHDDQCQSGICTGGHC